MRLSITLILLLVSHAARAADRGSVPTPVGSDAQRAWSEFEYEAATLEADAFPDCSAAFKALTSLARATEHLCALAPERCQTAQARLKAARDRVHASCPELSVPPSEDRALKHAAPSAPQAGGSPPTARKTAESAAPEVATNAPMKGGCASCSQADQGGHTGAIVLALGVLAFLRKPRRFVRRE